MKEKPKDSKEKDPPSPPSLEEKENFRKRIDLVWEHIEEVRRNGKKLVNKLIDNGEFELARRLAYRFSVHDASKFTGVEFEALGDSKHPLFQAALENHRSVNDHHPEFFVNGIADMNDQQLGELSADWVSRAVSQASDLEEWVKTVAVKKFNFSLKGPIYKKIKKFINMILEDNRFDK